MIVRTACSRDCPDACSLLVTVDARGRARRLRGDPEDPVTRGFLCPRTSRFLDRQYAPERFTSPLLRRQGRLVPVSWDEALDFAATRLLEVRRRHGPEGILHYRSGGSLGMLKLAADFLFEQFGPVSLKRGDICSGAGEAAQEMDFGQCDSHDLFDLFNSRLILLWGKNAHTSGVHLLPVLQEARRRGARLVGVDVVRTRTMQMCQPFLQVRPGGDFALAMGVARCLFESGRVFSQFEEWCENTQGYRALAFSRSLEQWAAEAGVAVAQVLLLADLYWQHRPAALLVGWGLARRSGGATAVRALDALAALAGNLGVPGGGVSYYFRRRGAFDTSLVRGLEVAPRSFSEARLGPELLAADPPVRAIWVTAANPVSMLPDSEAVAKAFRRAELVVVVDTHPTDTTDCAHLVLPTLTLLEDDDLLGAYGNHYLRASSPALAPPGQARHELSILQDLAARLGLGDRLAGSVADWKRRFLAPVEDQGVTLEALARGAVRNPRAPRVLFEGGRFPTPSGKMRLLTEPPPPPPRRTPRFPLALMASSTPWAQASQWSVPAPWPPEARVHPASAAGLAHGEVAWVQTARGRMQVRLLHDPDVHPEVLLLAKGGMLRQGGCANRLIEARETDHGGGAAYYEEPCCLMPLASPAPGS